MDQLSNQEGEEGTRVKSGGGSSGGGGEASGQTQSHPRPNKPVVEDRALQAVLAARRRSLENAGKAEPVGGRLRGSVRVLVDDGLCRMNESRIWKPS